MIAEPVEIPLAVPVELPRVSLGTDSGRFATPDQDPGLSLSISHAYNKRTRRLFRLDSNANVPDEWDPSINSPLSTSVYFVADVPKFGVPLAGMVEMSEALFGALLADSSLILTKFLGGES
jgi:hypothetical protein